jgi:excisionase family DNA binding protein
MPHRMGSLVPRRGEGSGVVMVQGPERPLAEVRFLTVAEVASIMRVSKMTVYRLVHAGDLPAVRVGRSFRVPEQAVHDYLSGSFVETA